MSWPNLLFPPPRLTASCPIGCHPLLVPASLQALLGVVGATAATGGDLKLILQMTQRSSPSLHRPLDILLRYIVTEAYIHFLTTPYTKRSHLHHIFDCR